MANLNAVLRDEITRLARKVATRELALLRQQSAQYRRDIAALKRKSDEQAREIAFLRGQEKKRIKTEPEVADTENVRFSPAWLKKHREKLGLSAADYGKLVGVSALSIYKWENEQAEPRAAQKAKLAAVRGLGKREALKRLELIGQ